MKTKSLFAAAITGLCTSVTFAQVGPELLLKPMPEPIRFDGRVSATYFFDAGTNIDGPSGVDAQLARYFGAGRVRLMPGNRADPRFGFSVNTLTVDTTNDILPESFTDAQIGIGTGIAEYEGWVAGLTFGLGFAGANEFGESSGYYGTSTLLLGRQLDKHTSLGIALDYNGSRSFMPDVPLPGIVWTRQIPERQLEVSLGFPFAYGRWRPTEKLLLEVNFSIPDFVGARVAYDIVEGVGLFGSLSRRTEAWRAEGFGEENDRILFEQTMAEFGARFSIHDRFTVLVAGGYAFGQEFSVGFDSRNTDALIQIDDGPFVRIEGQFAF